jgi:hypothetical protein
MNPLFVLCCAPLFAMGSPPESKSYTYQPAAKMDHELRGPAVHYAPQPGDIVLAANNSIFSVIGHYAAGTGYPNHSMIVFARKDGSLGILEAGPHGKLKQGMVISACLPHLASYEDEGRLWVRQRKVPLTAEQSACLTEFAYKEEGKRFAVVRVDAQATPFRSRMPVRAVWLGKPNPEKNAFFCSELVLNGCVYAGLMSTETTRPACTYPRDIFFGKCSNPFVNRSLREMECGWEPPARWTSCPCAAPDVMVVPNAGAGK